MENIFEIRFSFEQYVKDNIILNSQISKVVFTMYFLSLAMFCMGCGCWFYTQ